MDRTDQMTVYENSIRDNKYNKYTTWMVGGIYTIMDGYGQ